MNLTREARLHTLLQVDKLTAIIEDLKKTDDTIGDALFARKLGEAILACDVFVDSTKHQHRTLCDVIKGKRA